MGVQALKCPEIAVQEFRTELEQIAAQTSSPPLLTDPFVVLIGENNNILGLGFVQEVQMGTVTLVLPVTLLAALGLTLATDAEFTVSLCCVCLKEVDNLEGVALNIIQVLTLKSILGNNVNLPGL